MSFTSFGQVIPVTGQNNGFPGTLSRAGVPVVKSRQVLSTAAHNVDFGEAAVLIPNSTGGTFESIRDFVATPANIPNLAAQFAGIALREVKTHLTFPAGVVPGVQQVGYYRPGEMIDVVQLGSVTVQITHGTPQANGQVYARIVANAGTVGTIVGDLEAAPETVSTTGTASSGSTALTVASGTGIAVGQLITGAGIAPGTYVAAVAGTAVTLSAATTAALSSTAVVFANTVPLPYVVFATGNLDANGVAEITLKVRNAA